MPPATDITQYKGPVGSLRHRCPLCPPHAAAKPHLLRCGGCRAFRYCGREHQVAHRPQHKSACSKVKNARAKLDREDHKVRNATEDFMTPANAFETHVGRFWGLLHTRDYMRARLVLAERLVSLGTLEGVSEGLEHMRDMMRLCRSDNMGIRSIVPVIMLRLDLDQECYDFVKWWATCDPNGTYDWGDMTLPYLDTHGADVFENPTFLLGKYSALNCIVALLILKLKLLVDIRNLKIARKVLARRQLPLELRDLIEQNVVRSPLSAKFHKESYASLLEIEMKLMYHARLLGACIDENNDNFMFNLFEPEQALGDTPDFYSHGSWEEMVLSMQYSYAAWWETEGVLDLLNDARACASRDSEPEIEDMMKDPRTKKGRTAAEMLADMSVNRIWGYLEYAVENASYLGPWSERPSEQYSKENREEWDDIDEDEDEDAWTDDDDDDEDED
ncbi:hypothetical protein F4861DRAFT_521980 [Xylaria intraflava]|nr:hypothetical protein F4861DRAFT_521980 [Xylaria intraflava]